MYGAETPKQQVRSPMHYLNTSMTYVDDQCAHAFDFASKTVENMIEMKPVLGSGMLGVLPCIP
jgi:hypothetical protein